MWMWIASSFARLLRAFVSAAEEHDKRLSFPNEIDAKAWPVADAKFGDTIANRLHVAQQARLKPHDALGNLGGGPCISQRPDPTGEGCGLPHFDHLLTAVNIIESVNCS
jgi:hypothetical protein